MTIVLILCIPAAFALGAFSAFKGVQLGLRWRMQTESGQKPKMESPVTQVLETKQDEKYRQESKEIISEWMNGTPNAGR